MKQYKNIDEYIANFPEETQALLQQVRATIQLTAPNATEAIKYAIPTFVLNGNLVHFAGYKNHIGFYPAAQAIKDFEQELTAYKTSKGAIQFPINKPMPLQLIVTIVKYRMKQMGEKKSKKK